MSLAAGGTTTVSATFTVDKRAVTLTASPSSVSLPGEVGGAVAQGTVAVSTSDSSSVPVTVTSDQPWLSGGATAPTTPTDVIVTADPSAAGEGSHTGTLTVSSPGLPATIISVAFSVAPQGGWPVGMVYSTSVDRTAPKPFNGATVSGVIYPYVAPDAGVSVVRFYLDDPEAAAPPTRVDTRAPFDLAGSTPGLRPNPWDSALLPDGPHTLTVQVDMEGGGTERIEVAFTTDNDTNSIQVAPGDLEIFSDPDDLPHGRDIAVEATKAGTDVTLTSNAAWLKVPSQAVVTPGSARVTIDPAGLDLGVYRGTVTAGSAGAFPAETTVTLTVGDPGGCTPVACQLIKVPTPYTLDFLYDGGRLLDSRGTGTGFTKVLGIGAESGYDRNKLRVDLNAGKIRINTTPGEFTDDNQVNAIGVGFDGQRAQTLSTTLVDIPLGTGKYEQAGVWFGYDQKNVDKFVVMSTSGGTRIQHTLEVDGVVKGNRSFVVPVGSQPVTLSLTTDPVLRRVTARYKVGDGVVTSLGSFAVPGEFFSFDAAGIDPAVGTRSFAGLMATHRRALSPLTYTFDNFSVTGDVGASEASEFAVSKVSYATPYPTAMSFGPDGKLYVANLMGQIRRLTIDAGYNVVGEELIGTLGRRLALGLTIDPASTPENVIVWVAHSSPSADAGEVDSGVITRLSGPGLTVRQDVITGLPRSIANHSTNGIKFGPDGKLYIAQGGNTGAGAANTADTEFGDRGEQALSAALLVADVQAAAFDGTCANTADMYGPAPCDVRVWASGLRNTYDFVIHSNGQMYGGDNGLGVVGSYPPSPTAPCFGYGDTRSWKTGGNNPQTQNDRLNRIEEGGYYGTPNPVRGECVFKDGSYQGVAPLPNYKPPLYDLGPDTSTNGIIEYQGGDNFCGDMNGDLLVSNYSVGDDIVRLRLNEDGTQVVSAAKIVGDFQDPLPLILGPDGTIWVGEFGGKVTAVVPKDTGCWSSDTELPAAVLDAGGAALDGKIYVVAGKTSSGHRSTAYAYDPATAAWTTIAPLPGAAVENPAVVAHQGSLYVFGGATAAFSGATTQAFRYDPGSDAWTALPALPAPRASATAQVVGGKLYVVGGVGAQDESLASVAVYDPGAGTWSQGPALLTPRDNPGTAVLDGALYAFGGRMKRADGTVVNGTLASVEMLDPVTGAWVSRKDMPTGRRTMVVGVLNGRAVVVGGEARADGGAFTNTEEYDPATDSWRLLRSIPTGRHGAVGAVLGGRLHVVGGGASAGRAFTAAHEVLRPAAD